MVIVGAIAELERSLIIERVKAGLRRVRLEGRHIGRPRIEVDRDAVLRDRYRGMSLTQIAQAYRISRALVSRILREAHAGGSHKDPSPSPLQVQENRPPESAA